MPVPCTVCVHEQRSFIDSDLQAGATLDATSSKFSVNRGALYRHRARHLGIVAKHVARELAHKAVAATIVGNELLSEMQHLRREAEKYRALAESNDDVKTALLALDRTTKLLELQSRLVLEQAAGRASDVASNPVWRELSAAIMQALEPYPDAARAVVLAIEVRLHPGGMPR